MHLISFILQLLYRRFLFQ